MTTYREYAKGNGHSDEEIEKMVGGLFGADAEMEEVGRGPGNIQYAMGNNYLLYVNFSTFDIVELYEGNITGERIEEWALEY